MKKNRISILFGALFFSNPIFAGGRAYGMVTND